jgi:hypothetical protein
VVSAGKRYAQADSPLVVAKSTRVEVERRGLLMPSSVVLTLRTAKREATSFVMAQRWTSRPESLLVQTKMHRSFASLRMTA